MKYLARSARFKGDIVFSYDQDGYLLSLDVKATLTDEQWNWFSQYFPVTETRLKLMTDASQMIIENIPDDLSFAYFWDIYKYKHGDKSKAEKLWNALSETEMVAAIAAVPKYLYWLACSIGIPQAHATTWLKQRRWENDFTVKK